MPLIMLLGQIGIFGFETDTGDAEGVQTGEKQDFSHVTDESLRAALGKFQGEISQVCLRAFPRVGVRVVCVDVCVDVWVCVCERMYNRLAMVHSRSKRTNAKRKGQRQRPDTDEDTETARNLLSTAHTRSSSLAPGILFLISSTYSTETEPHAQIPPVYSAIKKDGKK
eukprot:1108195-Rhodomonas_salina.2